MVPERDLEVCAMVPPLTGSSGDWQMGNAGTEAVAKAAGGTAEDGSGAAEAKAESMTGGDRRKVGFVDSSREENKARAVRFTLKRGWYRHQAYNLLIPLRRKSENRRRHSLAPSPGVHPTAIKRHDLIDLGKAVPEHSSTPNSIEKRCQENVQS